MSAFSSLRHLIKVRAVDLVQNGSLNFSSKAEEMVKWVRPTKVPSYLPIKSGDQSNFEMPDPKSFRKYFDTNEKLKNCSNELVCKIFKMELQSNSVNYQHYKECLIEKVQAHKFDERSLEVQIAKLTADIRIRQYLWSLKKSRTKIRCKMNELINLRRKKLMELRKCDYKKFEWLLEKLNLIFKADPIVCEVVYRKKSVKKLAELEKSKLQELKLSSYKEKLDKMKIPYLEKKMEKLLWIKEQETSLKLTPTVSDSDIEDLKQKIEAVKLQIEERCRKGYVRKVHPYTLETYEPKESSST